jgi:glycerophosphoryl diester phosphodiesterase
MKRRLFTAAACVAAFFLVCTHGFAQTVLSPLPLAKNKFIVISHRGNHVNVPENTVASVTEAIKSGADYAEIDLRTTKDGYLVLCHDASVDRMTDGKGNIKDLTLEEIKKLKITDNGVVYRIPEFREVLAACQRRINIYLDFKDADAAESYRQLKAAGMEKNVVVYLNKVPQYKDWRTVAPQMPLMSSIPREIKTAVQLDQFLGQVRIETLDNVYDTALLAVTRARGIAVWLDVEGKDENPAIWQEALGKGVQGVQTDHPDSLISYLNQYHWRDGVTRP